jgi:hypothetical protein
MKKTVDGVEYTIVHNGDWSGTAHVHWTEKEEGLDVVREVELPGELLIACARTEILAGMMRALEALDIR